MQPRVAAATCCPIDQQGDGGILEAAFASEPGLRHRGHANQPAAIALEPVDLGRGFEPGTLSYAIGHPGRYRKPGIGGCFEEKFS